MRATRAGAAVDGGQVLDLSFSSASSSSSSTSSSSSSSSSSLPASVLLQASGAASGNDSLEARALLGRQRQPRHAPGATRHAFRDSFNDEDDDDDDDEHGGVLGTRHGDEHGDEHGKHREMSRHARVNQQSVTDTSVDSGPASFLLRDETLRLCDLALHDSQVNGSRHDGAEAATAGPAQSSTARQSGTESDRATSRAAPPLGTRNTSRARTDGSSKGEKAAHKPWHKRATTRKLSTVADDNHPWYHTILRSDAACVHVCLSVRLAFPPPPQLEFVLHVGSGFNALTSVPPLLPCFLALLFSMPCSDLALDDTLNTSATAGEEEGEEGQGQDALRPDTHL